MERITYQAIRQECEDLVRNAIEEYMGAARDMDELREKVDERLHEDIDGHAWVIYYGKAGEVHNVIRSCDRQWYDAAYSDNEDIGGNVIGKDEDISNLYTRLAYCILRVGCGERYDEILEAVAEEEKGKAKECGKAWAEGFRAHSQTREEAYAAEENGRQYAPFEHTAKDFNDSPFSDELWEAFQEGIDEIFKDMLSEDDVDYWFCPDCLMAAVNDDYTGLDYSEAGAEERMEAIKQGLEDLGSIAPTGHVLTFSHHGCDCCGSDLAGELHGFVTVKAGGNDE